MSLSLTQQFEASLPSLSKPIRKMRRSNAEVFICRWTIRDKDPALKVLLKEIQRQNSAATAIVPLRGSHTRDKLADFGGDLICVPRECTGGFEHLACDIAAPIRSFLDGRDCLRDLSRAGCH